MNQQEFRTKANALAKAIHDALKALIEHAGGPEDQKAVLYILQATFKGMTNSIANYTRGASGEDKS